MFRRSNDKPRRRWYQYSLRTLFLLTLLVGIGMSAVATRMRTARRQRDAVAAIQESGGSVAYYHDYMECGGVRVPMPGRPPPGPLWLRRVLGDDFFTTAEGACVESDTDFEYLKQLDQLNYLTCGPKVTETGLAHLKELRRLRSLSLRSNRAVIAGLEHITALTELEELDLGSTNIGDAELERLQTMPQLYFLRLVETKITDAGLRHLEVLTRLEALELGGTQIGDAGLRHLEALTHLEELDLGGTQIGDAGVEHLSAFKQLRWLELGGTRIGDAGVERLGALKQLKRLGLGGTRITDAAVRHLTGMKHIVRLELQHTNVSAEGVMKIEQALPDCDVRSSVPSRLPPVEAESGETPITSGDPFATP